MTTKERNEKLSFYKRVALQRAIELNLISADEAGEAKNKNMKCASLLRRIRRLLRKEGVQWPLE